MVKRLKLATRAFGAEPDRPDVAALAEWIADHRGRAADIITYQLDRSLAPQIPAGIQVPCAGGKFYADRILSAFPGVKDGTVVDELHVDTQDIIEDSAGIVVQKRNAWCAMPAPHALGITDDYYDDDEEWSDALCGAYRSLMRAMRDIGVAGHVLICNTIDNAELVALAQPKIFFFQPEPGRDDLVTLLERQRQVAVRGDQLKILFGLREEYTIQKVFLIDPDPQAIALARTHLDPDQIVAGGYCVDAGGSYWTDLVNAAECPL